MIIERKSSFALFLYYKNILKFMLFRFVEISIILK